MSQSRFSLSWAAHKSNICTGLSYLQQNSEFVDMTLAADGHHVKVHQVIMALASPYIKELISSAQCPHPVIFLNKISYETLSAILEYIYTGEVLVSTDNLPELIEAGKDLHIKGLENMKLNQEIISLGKPEERELLEKENEDTMDDEYCYFEISNEREGEKYVICDSNTLATEIPAEHVETNLDNTTYDETMVTEEETVEFNQEGDKDKVVIKPYFNNPGVLAKKIGTDPNEVKGMMQYTVSNQGSLQMILNRFVYYLKHTKLNGTRQWRCVDYLGGSRCPALVVTQDDVVVQRISAHTHSFHDKRILKKVQAGSVFTAIHEAEKEGKDRKEGCKALDHNIKEIEVNITNE